jgi:hypothetical protein
MKMTFGKFQPLYAAHGIATFPVDDGPIKKPAVKSFMRMGMPASRQLTFKFADAPALGFVCGKRSRITALDIDSASESVLADAIGCHGDSPIVIKTASGGYHAWFRHNGEKRMVRPFGRDLPIDIIGNGLIIAPPSRTAKGTYEFINGGLDDIDRLPVLRGLPEAPKPIPAANDDHVSVAKDDVLVPHGTRNDKLWRMLMREAAKRDKTLDQLVEWGRQKSLTFELDPPMTQTEIFNSAKSALRYEAAGLNGFGHQRVVSSNFDTEVKELAARDVHALALLMMLRGHHFHEEEFFVANAMAESLGWTRKRFAAARKFLEGGWIEMVRRPTSATGPALYRWVDRSEV